MNDTTGRPTWPENRLPTAAEWADWFVANPVEEREQIAARVLEASREASECFQRNHEGLMSEANYLRGRLWRYQIAWRSARRYRWAMRKVLSGQTQGQEIKS